MPSILSRAGASRSTPDAERRVYPGRRGGPRGDPVAYRLHVGLAFGSRAGSGSQTRLSLPAPQFGTTYYWQVSAVDALAPSRLRRFKACSSPWTTARRWRFRPDRHGALSTRHLTAPLLGSIAARTETRWPTLSSFRATPSLYPLCKLSTATGFLLAFQYGTTYYWRVDAYDGFGGTDGHRRAQTFRHSSMTRRSPERDSAFKGRPSSARCITRSRSRGSG